MLRAGVSFPVLMKLLGHTDPEMTMRYVDLVPQPKASSIPLRAGLDGVIDSFARLSTCVGANRKLSRNELPGNLSGCLPVKRCQSKKSRSGGPAGTAVRLEGVREPILQELPQFRRRLELRNGIQFFAQEQHLGTQFRP